NLGDLFIRCRWASCSSSRRYSRHVLRLRHPLRRPKSPPRYDHRRRGGLRETCAHSSSSYADLRTRRSETTTMPWYTFAKPSSWHRAKRPFLPPQRSLIRLWAKGRARYIMHGTAWSPSPTISIITFSWLSSI